MAVDLIKPLNVIPILKEYHILELDSLSKYTFSQLNAKSKMIDSSIISTTYSKSSLHSELDTDDEEYDEDDYLNNNDEFISNIYEDSQSLNDSFDDDDEEEENMNSIKTDFDGIKILDHIKMEQKDRYFKIKINDKNQQNQTILPNGELPDNNQSASSTKLKKERNTNNQDSSLPNKQIQTSNVPKTSLPKSIIQRTNNTINILLLGETGVGKSTFINAFVNYLTHKTLKVAEQGKPVVIIPVSFVITTGNNFQEHTVKFGDLDSFNNEDFDHPGQSVTQNCRSYVFHFNHINTTKIRIIDTPGFGDTRGVHQDDINMQYTLEYINDLTHLDAICFLLKPNTSRINVFFATYLNQLFDFLGSNACQNVIFCFTNARSTFYTPGDTAPLLKSILKSIKIGEIPFKKENTFCFDNESFRYLVALQNNIKFDTIEHSEYNNSWSKSVEESNRLLDYICAKVSTYDMQGGRQSIKQAQFEISYIIRPMLEAMRNILRNSIIYKNDASSGSITLEPHILDRPGAICYRCKPNIIQIGKFLITRNPAHEMRKKCLSCPCTTDQHTRVDYELDYTHSKNRSNYDKDETEKSINLLLEASVKFAYFLKHISCSSKDDPFWIGIKQMINEENNLRGSQKSHDMNKILAEMLTELMHTFKKQNSSKSYGSSTNQRYKTNSRDYNETI
ncbi:unnamed protein product [Rotaria sordida]|nr:unnamed protein product [Rotaria sordida]